MHRVCDVTFHAWDLLDLVDDGVCVRRVIQLKVKHRSLILGSIQILQNSDLQEFSGPLALSHDSRNAKFVVQDFHFVANLDVLRLGQDIVDQHVVRPLERTALDEVEGA